MAVQAVNVPLKDIAFGEVMSERLQMPVVVDNDANCHTVCESRLGIAQGATDVALLTLGTGIGGGLLLSGEIYRGWIMGGAEMGHMVVEMNGRPCQGNCPNWGCLESVASGTALVREASLAVARQPDTALGHALEEGRELTGPLITELATAGDPVARGAIETIGRALGVGIVNLVNIFNPQVVVIGGGVIAAGELLLAPAREVMLERALAPGQGRRARRGRPHGSRGGDDRRGPARAGRARRGPHGRHRSRSPPGERRGSSSARRRSGTSRTSRCASSPRCATPTWSRARTRATRKGLLKRHGVSATLVSYHEHNERARAGELVERMRAGATVALVERRGHAARQRPGLRPRPGHVAAGLTVEVLPGPSATITALVASGLPNDVWRFAGFLPRKAGPLREVFAAPETVVAFESPRRVGASLKVLAELDPERPVAVCRELTKLHEEIVRGTRAGARGEVRARRPARRDRARGRRGARSPKASTRRRSTR